MFRVNGVNCHLKVDGESIAWTPLNDQISFKEQTNSTDVNSKRRYTLPTSSKSIPFDQIIAFQQTKKQIKILYCKRLANGQGALLKPKRLSIKQSDRYGSSISSSLSSLPSASAASASVTNAQAILRQTSAAGGRSITRALGGSLREKYGRPKQGKQNEPRKWQSTKTTKHQSRAVLGSEGYQDQVGDKSNSNSLVNLSNQISSSLELKRRDRPKKLLIFVNPFGGKGRALQLYKTVVRRLLDEAQIEHQMVITKRANHARSTIEDLQFNVEYFDGIVCIGGDGMFSELMNGLLFRYNRQLINHKRKIRDACRGPTKTTSKSSSEATDLNQDHGDDQQCKLEGQDASANTTPTNTSARSMHQQTVLPAQIQINNGAGEDGNFPGKTSDEVGLDHEHHNLDQAQQEAVVLADGANGEALKKHHKTKTSKQNKRSGDNNKPERDQERTRSYLMMCSKLLGGIGQPFQSPPIPIGVIGAGSTDANSFGLIGTNDVITATLNIILGNQIDIDVCSIHSLIDDEPMRFVSTFVGYGYFGDVIRESEKFRWMGPSRYDLTGLNTLIKNRTYNGYLRILASNESGSPLDEGRCHSDCAVCMATGETKSSTEKTNNNTSNIGDQIDTLDRKFATLQLIERQGPFTGVNGAVTACRCPQTKKGFAPANHLANGCADLILVRPCSRLQYLHYLVRTGWTKKSPFELNFVEAYRCRQFEFIADEETCGLSTFSSASSNLSSKSPSELTSLSLNSITNSITNSSQPFNDDDGSHANSLDSGRGSTSTKQEPLSPLNKNSLVGETLSSWNVDGEILNEHSIRVKVNNRLLRVFGTGEPK